MCPLQCIQSNSIEYRKPGNLKHSYSYAIKLFLLSFSFNKVKIWFCSTFLLRHIFGSPCLERVLVRSTSQHSSIIIKKFAVSKQIVENSSIAKTLHKQHKPWNTRTSINISSKYRIKCIGTFIFTCYALIVDSLVVSLVALLYWVWPLLI